MEFLYIWLLAGFAMTCLKSQIWCTWYMCAYAIQVFMPCYVLAQIKGNSGFPMAGCIPWNHYKHKSIDIWPWNPWKETQGETLVNWQTSNHCLKMLQPVLNNSYFDFKLNRTFLLEWSQLMKSFRWLIAYLVFSSKQTYTLGLILRKPEHFIGLLLASD